MASLTKKFSRLTRMGPSEIATRLRQWAMPYADSLRYAAGLPILIKIFGKPPAERPAFFFTATEAPGIAGTLAERFPEDRARLMEAAETICQHKFDLLGYRGLDYGAEIKWHTDMVNGVTAPAKPWNRIQYLEFSEVGDAKVTWELSRQQHLIILARANLLSQDKKYLRELQTQFRSWQAANPYPIGVNWASSLEVAFRSLSWIWVFHLLPEEEQLAEFRRAIVEALSINARHIETYLSTYFSANTHLLGEAVALFFIGTLFPEIEAAPRWKRLGWELIQEHAEKKVLADGAYFEQSTYYHVYALDMFLHAHILAKRNRMPIPETFDGTIRNMLEFLAALNAGGAPPRFGDDDGGRWFDGRRNRVESLRDPLAIGAVLFNEPRFKIAGATPTEEMLWLLGTSAVGRFDELASRPPQNSTAFRDSGTYILASAGSVLTIDAGPLGGDSGGHGHADALSVNLSANGEPMLVDPGAFHYVGKDRERERFRTTGAHNTLQIDASSQAEPAGAFSWRAMPSTKVELWIPGESFDLFAGSQDGYARMGIAHRRWVFNLKSDFFFVCDEVSGPGEHLIDVAWRLAPGCNARPLSEDRMQSRSLRGVQLSFVSAIISGIRLRNDEYFYSAVYGQKQAAAAVHQTTTAALPIAVATLLTSGSGAATDAGTLHEVVSLSPQSRLLAYNHFRPESTGTIVLALGARKPWYAAHFESDADFLYCCQDRYGKISKVITCNGSWASFHGNDLFRKDAAVERFESEVQHTHAGTRSIFDL